MLAVSVFALAACSEPAAPGAAPAGPTVFRTNMQSEPDTIDPSRANFNTSILVASQVFDGLFSYDQQLNLVPGVAERIPTRENGDVSADGLTYTIKLRESRWSDGKPVTAADFAFAIRRVLDPALAAPYATAMYDIEGAEAYNTALGTKDAPKRPTDAELASASAALERLVCFAVDLLGDHLGAADLQFVALAAHVLDQHCKLQFTSSGNFEHVG